MIQLIFARVLPAQYRRNYGDLSRDMRHNFQATWIAELPFGKAKPWVQNGPAAQVLGGWQISGVLSAYTGPPFTATSSNTSLNSQASTQRADCLVSPPQKLGDIFQWYKKSDFGVPTTGRFGTCGANSLRGPGVVNLDGGIDRKWRVRERLEMRLRAEAFNVANTPHHANPTNSVNSGSFMQATDIRNTGRDGLDERTFRFGLRFTW